MVRISRKKGQVVWVGPARVTVERVTGGRVYLAIAAPAAVGVVREELLQGAAVATTLWGPARIGPPPPPVTSP